MPPPDDPSADRLEEAIAAYLESPAESGPGAAERLVAEYPDVADQLRQFLDDHHRALEVAQSWTAVPGETPAQLESPLSSDSLPTLDDYELLHELARGGMGVIYKARQVSLNRIVAVKMILQGELASTEDVGRFRLEAKAVAQLAHPHIVAIHDVAATGDRQYFSMEYVEGETVAQSIRRGPLGSNEAARLAEQVARALDYAHRQGVVHRDVKPSNVLIDQHGNARVTDFGLAKEIDRGENLTLTGQMVGTPAYMAPEQISDMRGAIGPACDIYGLGALLYEMLTGRQLFGSDDPFATLLQVLDCDPTPPRQIDPEIPRDLELICLKCLAKEPERRYASAGQAADDLARHLAGESISISNPNLVDRIVHTLQRSHYDRQFRTWSKMLVYLAWISLSTHVAVFLNRWLEPPHPIATLAAIRLAEVAGIIALLWATRKKWYPPSGPAVRQLLSLWMGYMTGSITLAAATRILTPADAPLNDFLVYPPMAVLASLLFIMLGSSYWGYCYAIGAMFLVLALVMSVWIGVAPLLFGAAWAGSLITLSVRLRRLSPSNS